VLCQNQTISSDFLFTAKDRGRILEAKDMGSNRTWNRLLQISRFSWWHYSRSVENYLLLDKKRVLRSKSTRHTQQIPIVVIANLILKIEI